MYKFQSTLPARGATISKESARKFMRISIHAPRTGSDAERKLREVGRQGFQSTLPARGATKSDNFDNIDVGISIHAPRTGSDVAQFNFYGQQSYISIHAPRTGSDLSPC